MIADFQPNMISSARSQESSSGYSMLRIVALVLRMRRLIAGFALAFGVAFLCFVLTADREYSSRGSFLPQAKSPRVSASAIASQLGLDVQGASPGQSPTFFSDLIRSRTILGAIVDSSYVCGQPESKTRCSLITFLVPREAPPAIRREEAIDELQRRVTSWTSVKTGVVGFQVTLTSPTLAAQAADRIFDEIQNFNLSSRQEQAGAERRFMQRQLSEAAVALTNSEAKLEYFLQRNRDLRSSPELVTRQERLSRDVAFRQQEVLALRKSLEDVRLEEVRDTPVIIAVEKPTLPVRPDPRHLVSGEIAALLLGLATGFFVAFIKDAFRAGSSEKQLELDELRALRQEAVADLRDPRRLLRPRRA